jgi:hypothetical protein
VRTKLVYTCFVKNITFSADATLIDKAREVAKSEHKTLNVAFREWLASYGARKGNVQQFRALMERLKHIDSAGPYTRDEMNER